MSEEKTDVQTHTGSSVESHDVDSLSFEDLRKDESGSSALEELHNSTQSQPFQWEEFDNNKGGKFKKNYSSKDYDQLLSMYGEAIASINQGDIIDGMVIDVTPKEIIFDLGYKSDGIVSISEFRDLEEGVKAGDKFPLFIEALEDGNGQLVVSREKAKMFKSWEYINESFEQDRIIEGLVKSRTKGGLIVDIDGIEAFLPGSQIDVKPIRDFDVFVGKKMEFKVVKITPEFKNVIVSHKILIEKELEQQKAEIISKLEKGQILEGIVKNITDFGAFIDLGGVDGLLYITDISWTRIDHPKDVLELDQKIKVVVLDFDDEKKRISLGLKQFTPHPWDSLDASIVEGSKVKGKVVTITSYGFFIEIVPGVEGLIHSSEISWSSNPVNPNEMYNIGDEIEAVVLTVDREDRKMSLGIKQLTEDPWLTVEESYPVGSKHTTVVNNIANYGVFVEFENGLSGLIHISDLSWTKKVNHPNEFTSVGDKLEVIVLEIDKEQKKLKLGHKQIDANPWDSFGDVFEVDTKHEGEIIKMTPKGALVALPYGIEGFAPTKHLAKEDGTKVANGDTLEFQVIEFDKFAKKVILSHTAIWQKGEDKEEGSSSSSKGAAEKSRKKAISKIQNSIENTTLGEQSSELSKLKEEFLIQENKEKGTKKAKGASEEEGEVEAPVAKKKATTAKKKAKDSEEGEGEETETKE